VAKACRKTVENLNYEDGEHPGLLLSRYLKEPANNNDAFNSQKEELFKGMRESLKKESVHSLYKLAFDRMQKSLPQKSIISEFKTEGRTIVGLGASSPAEVGMRMHHTYGVPVIPGSSLKGLAAHYCNNVWGGVDSRYQIGGEYHTVLFGTTDESGRIIFHEAWITPGTLKDCLASDIMTPHHSDYQNESNAPTDFDDPIPVRFLSVKGTFCVALSCDDKSDEGDKWASLAMKVLTEALENWGAGGKTSSGYGRMKCIQPPAGQTKSATSTAAATNPIADFSTWYDQQRFGAGNKGRHGEIKQKIERLPEDQKQKAREYVKSKLKEKDTSSGTWTYLSNV